MGRKGRGGRVGRKMGDFLYRATPRMVRWKKGWVRGGLGGHTA
jgi:hypothetical protein